MSDYMNFIGQAMDVASIARNATADNVSNYNTPNYKAVEVDFTSFFADENARLKQTNEKHIAVDGNDKGIYREATTEEGSNGNNVDLNKEMAEMIKNNYRFNMVVTAFNKEAGMIRKALGN